MKDHSRAQIKKPNGKDNDKNSVSYVVWNSDEVEKAKKAIAALEGDFTLEVFGPIAIRE
jgi:hypothetical protein